MNDQRAYTDGPNTHKYPDAHFITNWTLVRLDDPDGVTHVFHVPTRILEMERALVAADRIVREGSDPASPEPALDVEGKA